MSATQPEVYARAALPVPLFAAVGLHAGKPGERVPDGQQRISGAADRLRRGREKIEKALTDTLTGRTEDLVKKINDLRERIEGHGSAKRTADE